MEDNGDISDSGEGALDMIWGKSTGSIPQDSSSDDEDILQPFQSDDGGDPDNEPAEESDDDDDPPAKYFTQNGFRAPPAADTLTLAEPPSRADPALLCMPLFYSSDATRSCRRCRDAGLPGVKTPVYCRKCNVPLCLNIDDCGLKNGGCCSHLCVNQKGGDIHVPVQPPIASPPTAGRDVYQGQQRILLAEVEYTSKEK